MLRNTFNSNSSGNHITKLMLVFALLFASAHVALHELDAHGAELDGSGECQVCRLNHVSAATFDTPSLVAPGQILLYLLPIERFDYQFSSFLNTHHARAPPALI